MSAEQGHVIQSLTRHILVDILKPFRIKQKRYVQDEEALANSGAFTLSNPLVAVKDEGKSSIIVNFQFCINPFFMKSCRCCW